MEGTVTSSDCRVLLWVFRVYCMVTSLGRTGGENVVRVRGLEPRRLVGTGF